VTLTSALAELVRRPDESAFVTDYDGTLAPIVEDPVDARPLAAALAALQSLIGRFGCVAVISGRPVDFLQRVLPIDGLVLVGQYGLERLVDGEIVVDARALGHRDAVASARAEAGRAWPTLFIERKGDVAFTVHWRTDPSSEPAADELRALADRHGLVTIAGRKACEMRPPSDVDKGTAFREVVQGYRHAAFAGDDRGDLAVFEVAPQLRGHTDVVCIAVRSAEAPPKLLDLADVVVDGPSELAVLMAELAAGR